MERMKGRDGKREKGRKEKWDLQRKGRKKKRGKEKMGMERENWRERMGRDFGRNRRL